MDFEVSVIGLIITRMLYKWYFIVSTYQILLSCYLKHCVPLFSDRPLHFLVHYL